MGNLNDPTEISGRVDILPGLSEPLANADPTARTARLALGARPLSVAERQQRQEAMSCNVLDSDEAGTGCTQVLHLTVFFDGTGNNRDQEMAKTPGRRALSNIVRLYFTHVNPEINISVPYLAGVGTPCPEVGDSGGLSGMAIGNGGGERVEYALKELDGLIDKQSVKKILIINVSVFGFSRGAAQARAFVRDLAARCTARSDGTWRYRDLPLRIAFVGIFDTVCSVWSSVVTALFNAKDGHGEWAYDVKLPPIVEQSVHMTAAHELRPQFPLDSTRSNAQYPANAVEIWYPGVHSDVGGGYDPNHQGRKNSIARFALNEMYDMARSAGVLLQPLDKLASHIQNEFKTDDEELRSAYNGYLRAVSFKQGRLEDVQAAHMELMHRWLKVRVERGDDLTSLHQLQAREDALKTELRALNTRKRKLTDPYGGHRVLDSEQMDEWNAIDSAIREKRGELSEVSSQRKGLLREAGVLKRKMTALFRKREGGQELTLSERTMLRAWESTDPLPEAVELFFDGYGHDSTSHWFTGDLSKWRTIYFGETKYKPGTVATDSFKAEEDEPESMTTTGA